MSRRLALPSSQANGTQQVQVFSEGASVLALTPATQVPGTSFQFYVDLPTTLGPAAQYQWQLLNNAGTRLRGNGDFWWDGSDIVYSGANELTSNDVLGIVQTEGAVIISEVQDAQADVQADVQAVQTAVSGLNDVSVVDIEAALLDDGDASAFKAGLAATIEAALANEADGNATVAVFEGAVAAALAAYNTARVADVNQAATDVISALPTPSDATLARQDQIIAAIGALNDIDAATVRTEADAALAAYDAPTGAELVQAVSDIITAVTNGQGLTVAQEQTLERLKDIAEADEVYTPTKAQKLLKGTSTVLVDKDVTSTTTCDVDTSLIEAP